MTVRSGTPVASVVIPARGAAATLPDCLRALAAQGMPRDSFEALVVVDRDAPDEDARSLAAEAGAALLVAPGRGAAAARNAGIAAARGAWVAFIDADCIPSRRWLSSLVGAVARDGDDGPPRLGAAGMTVGYELLTPAARFVDLTGGLSAEKHLAHPLFPWAPTSNALYRRDALLAVGGFDERFVSYEGCDLHTRLLRAVGGAFTHVPAALVYHRHRAGWRAYWRQQLSYGRGFGQFFRCYASELRWSLRDELRTWLSLVGTAIIALTLPRGEAGLVRRGTVVKQLAQRIGFAQTYWNSRESAKWRGEPSPRRAAAPSSYQREYPRMAPWWSPWGLALRFGRTFRQPADVWWSLRIGWFVARLSTNIERTHLARFLERVESEPRPRDSDPRRAAERIVRLRQPWLRLPGMRSHDTCYVRALALYRFLDPGAHEIQLRVGVEWHDKPGGVLRGHAWVTMDGTILEGPPEAEQHDRLQIVELRTRAH